MTTTPKRVAAALLTGAALTLAACGGDDGGEALSRAELVAQAERICTDVDRKLDAIDSSDGLDAFVEAARGAQETASSAVEDLRDLQAPDEISADYDRWVGLMDEQTEILGTMVTALAERDEETLQSVAEDGEDVERRSDALAREIGLDGCATG